MQPHIANTKVTTLQAHEEREKVLNAHMMMWTIVLGPQKRTANNFQAWNNDIRTLYGLHKDHKFKCLICDGKTINSRDKDGLYNLKTQVEEKTT
ncbi:Hypothetical predicted protein [Octopus vulgaris]|uniref:Uncharacterized protein n=1 Tax=Octopus vulgaris TaxID=6645 RepID=A0AA36BLB7_OCTVU|nr:Hypothetical predicted protein [Octopus vulgaris]